MEPINDSVDDIDSMIFVKQFNVLDDPEDDINCTEISKLLYEVLLTRFKISITEEAHQILFIYQNVLIIK